VQICTLADGFTVVPVPQRATADDEDPYRRRSETGSFGAPPPTTETSVEVDCTQPCSAPPLSEAFAVHQAEVAGRDYLPPEPVGIDLFRTPAACAAADAPPSVLPTDLCATLGARLR
jgi:hypothetical protein